MNELQLLLLLAAIFSVSLVALWLVKAVGFYRKYHGKRLITCPETHKTEAVEIAAVSGAAKVLIGPELRLRDCTRWPERADCGQYCLSQIEEAPEDCLMTRIVADWYAGRACVYCKQPFAHIEWHEHRPALRNLEGKLIPWPEVPAQTLPVVLSTHQPVCWQCYVHESFRRDHPELVTDRADRIGAPH